MKKVIYNSLLPLIGVLIGLTPMACKDDKRDGHCYLHDEMAGSRFSIYYLGDAEPVLKGDLAISKDLHFWQYSDGSDFQKHAIGDSFINGTGRLLVKDDDGCQEENYTMRFIAFNKKESRDFKLIKRSVDDRFGVPIFSYLFETVDLKTGKKAYYQFNRE